VRVSDPFLGEIKIEAFNFAPKGWAFCNGQTLPINQNQALFSLLGTTYGGNGQTTFMLPNLQGRVPLHAGASYQGTMRTLGQAFGEEVHTLTSAEMPAHTHTANVVNANANVIVPTGNWLGVSSNLYQRGPANTALAPSTISSVGDGQPHENRQPYTVLNFCIALVGIYPSRN
jgi:microcystin-dependent protein